jgi:hypothetical protein
LDELDGKKVIAKNTLERCKKALKAIDAYVDKLDVEHLDISKLGEAMDIYDSTEEKWEKKIILIEKEIASLDMQISDEELRLEKKIGNKKLRTQVVVGLYAESAAELEITLIYGAFIWHISPLMNVHECLAGVSHAHWQAGYDIRVDMQNPTRPVKVVYKANISQQTGEVSQQTFSNFVGAPNPINTFPLQAWENAPITLETTNPTFGLDIPVLRAWNLSHENPRAGGGLGQGGAMRHRKIMRDEDDLDYDEHQTTQVTSVGSVNATFRIPGRTTIPSNDEEHSVTVADLRLDAKVTWICIPKGDTRVHLEVRPN